jgi:adenylate kinase family enzyme
MKIHIIGGPGSGKTFIAQHLAERYGIPVLDLDEIFWDHEKQDYGTRADPEKRDAALAAFIGNEKWIVEGVYYRWLGPSFQAADEIFVLTPPRWLRQARIIRRFFRRKLGLDRSKKETLRGQLDLMAWNHKYDGDNLMRTIRMLKELSLPFTRCATLAEVLDYLKKNPNQAIEPRR